MWPGSTSLLFFNRLAGGGGTCLRQEFTRLRELQFMSSEICYSEPGAPLKLPGHHQGGSLTASVDMGESMFI